MSLSSLVSALATRVGQEVKAVRADIAALNLLASNAARGRLDGTPGTAFDVPTVGTTKLVVSTLSAIPMIAGRKYVARLELSAGWYGSVVGDGFTVGIDQDGTSLGSTPVYITNVYQYIPPGAFATPFTTTTGNHVFRAWAQRTGGTGILQFRGRLDIYDEGV